MKKRYARCVPRKLTDDVRKKCKELSISMYRKLIQLSSSQRAAVVTCDESWFFISYYYDSKWCREGEEPPSSPKRLINEEKIMFFVAFSTQGPILLHSLPTNISFTSTDMCQHILEELTTNAKASIKNVTKKNLILHFDNARPHIAKSTTEKIDELHWERLEQPPYSPDISPCDFFLFGYVKSKFPSYHCSSTYDLNKAIRDICQKIPKKYLGKCL